MRIFITGAAGKLGQRLAERLTDSHEIVAFDRADPPEKLPANVRYVQADLRDAEKVTQAAADAQAVIHLGAIPGPVQSIPSSEIFAINTQGTYQVLDAAERTGARIVILASSLCAIGFPTSIDNHGLSYLPVDEDHPCCPRNAYDLSKLVNEKNAEMFTRVTGIPSICFRFPALVDVSTSTWLPAEVRSETPHLVLTDYLDFTDAVDVIEVTLARPDLTHEVFFVNAETSGTSQTTLEYIKRFNPQVEWRGNPPTDTTPLINCTKLKQTLGYTPKVTWQQGMAEPPRTHERG